MYRTGAADPRRPRKSPEPYRRHYEGLYCVGCEQFYPPGELAAGRCPEHGTRPGLVSEENWFFRLSRYATRLRALITNGTIRIEPAERRNEVLALIDGGLEDFSVSRSTGRARGWGIPVPGDPGQVIYVWWDGIGNLINRVVSLTCRYRASRVPETSASAPDAAALEAAIAGAPALIAAALHDFDFRRATEAVWQIANEANRYVNHTRPWTLAKTGADADLDAALSVLLRACQAIGTHLAPFLPDAAARITRQCAPNETGTLPAPTPLLPRIQLAGAPGNPREPTAPRTDRNHPPRPVPTGSFLGLSR